MTPPHPSADEGATGTPSRADRRDVLLFEDTRADRRQGLLFVRPRDWITCHRPEDLDRAFAEIEAARARGMTIAGYFAYELGYLLEPAIRSLLPADRDGPLVSVGVWDPPLRMDGAAIDDWLASEAPAGDARIEDLRVEWDLPRYRKAFERVHEYILGGDVYQINLTFPLTFRWTGEPLALYRALRLKSRPAHAAFLRRQGETVLSFSPELFVAVEDGVIRARPMKGTIGRYADPGEDREAARGLALDDKQRAENLMIVDLLRNDLGRLAALGSVRVDDLFTVETYPALHAMTSGISARLLGSPSLIEILKATFPCGSVTGAPKVRAMEIIREVEGGPRGVYCGSLGWIDPGGNACFNVAIRTLVLRGDEGRMGVGSGVVADSDADSEYAECLLKARFLADPLAPFGLIETLRWTPEEGYWLRERHLARMRGSATYFLMPWNAADIADALDGEAKRLGAGRHRVRLVLWEDGRIEITSSSLAPPVSRPITFAISGEPIDRSSPFFRHKTTRREVYDGTLARLSQETGCDEVLFRNEAGELTEGSRTNLFAEKEGILFTPPLASGVLAGCLRAEMMAHAHPPVLERVLFPSDLAAADRIWLGNSVRGLMEAVPLPGLLPAVPRDQVAEGGNS